MPKVFIPRGMVLHTEAVCAVDGYACPLHRPSAHHMVEWPMAVRADNGLVERLCEHGIGHPDPDSVRFWVRERGETWYGLHGCDGCCAEPNKGALQLVAPG